MPHFTGIGKNFLKAVMGKFPVMNGISAILLWNSDHREKIYISYDPANQNCQAGDIDIADL